MNYDSKYKIFKEEFSITGLSYDELFTLYNIIGVIYLNLKKKNPDIKILDVLNKVVPKLPVFENHLKPVLSMQLQVMLEEQEFKPKTTLNDIDSMKKIISQILENWIPF